MGIENPVHLIFIAAVALIVLGPKRLPDLARALGQGMREFRESMSQGADGGRVPTCPSSAAVAPAQPQLPTAERPVPRSSAAAPVRREPVATRAAAATG